MEQNQNNNVEYRAYFLVMRNIGVLDKGIQSIHAIIEYVLKYPNCKEYLEWAINHKTVILLDGGTSVTTEIHANTLKELGIKYAIFREPDLNNSLTSIAMIVPDFIYDTVKYPLPLYENGFKNLSDLDGKTLDDILVFSPEEVELKNKLGLEGIKYRVFLNQFNLAKG